MAQEDKVASLLSSYQAFVTYEPLRTEVSWSGFVRFPQEAIVESIPPRASLDPAIEARRIQEAVGSNRAALLIPGRRFDAFGTRHGQGGGWYDRFLAEVPREWLRIGFCFDDQFSKDPLPRESWDQAMDYVVVVNRKIGAVSLYSSEGEPL
jgi:5-formyltetrahydrofolate cyclo-ligase